MKDVYVGVQFEEPKMRDEKGNRIAELSFCAIQVLRNSDYNDHHKLLMDKYPKLKPSDLNEWRYVVYCNEDIEVIMYTIATNVDGTVAAEYLEANKQNPNIVITNPIKWKPYDIYLQKVITVVISIGIGARVLFSWGVL
jgi:hypothetical protein